MKAKTGDLEEATEAVGLDIKQLGESVSKAIIFHVTHINHLEEEAYVFPCTIKISLKWF